MTAVALVSVPAVGPGLPAVPGPVHVGAGLRPIDPGVACLLHHDDLVLVLDTAASVTVLAAARVVLGAETLELYLYLVLGVAPVASAAAAPGHGPGAQVPRPAAGPAARPARRPLPLDTAG